MTEGGSMIPFTIKTICLSLQDPHKLPGCWLCSCVYVCVFSVCFLCLGVICLPLWSVLWAEWTAACEGADASGLYTDPCRVFAHKHWVWEFTAKTVNQHFLHIAKTLSDHKADRFSVLKGNEHLINCFLFCQICLAGSSLSLSSLNTMKKINLIIGSYETKQRFRKYNNNPRRLFFKVLLTSDWQLFAPV